VAVFPLTTGFLKDLVVADCGVSGTHPQQLVIWFVENEVIFYLTYLSCFSESCGGAGERESY
jgi:hypothetical protein